jgi:hypothetical protein
MQAEGGERSAHRLRLHNMGKAGKFGDPGEHGADDDGGEAARNAPGQTHM